MMANEKRLIDANRLLEELRKHRKPGYGYATMEVGLAPTVDAVEVVHGQWELYPSSMYRRCSVCKMEYDRPKFNVRANYCPNCGADMRGHYED